MTKRRQPPTPLRVPNTIVTHYLPGTRLPGTYRSSISLHQIRALPQITQLQTVFQGELRKQHLSISKSRAKAKEAIQRHISDKSSEPYSEKFTAGMSAVAVNSFGALSGGTRPLDPSMIFKSLKSVKPMAGLLKTKAVLNRDLRDAQERLKDNVQRAAIRQESKPLRDFHKPAAPAKPKPVVPIRERIRYKRERARELKVAEHFKDK